MSESILKFSSGKLFALVFHLVLWSIWIGLPLINSGDNEKYRLFSLYLIPVNLSNIPLFLLNTEWLIPKILRKKGVATYLISLILLVAIFSAIHYFMKEWFIPSEVRFGRNSLFWAIVPVLFVAAISTGYGFIVYLRKQEKEQQEEQQERLKSELSFLRSQISPHFIFNILNSIVYLIRSKSDLAEDVTIRLSELMRYMLYNTESGQVALEQEVDYLKNYIELQRIRFQEDVQIDLEITGSGIHANIEQMILIPFVENAFKHGVGLIDEPIIDVHLHLEQEVMTYWVRNKIAPESAEEKDMSSGIGLKNVKRRLELLYPNSHSLSITEKEGWFEVQMEIRFAVSQDNLSFDTRVEPARQ